MCAKFIWTHVTYIELLDRPHPIYVYPHPRYKLLTNNVINDNLLRMQIFKYLALNYRGFCK